MPPNKTVEPFQSWAVSVSSLASTRYSKQVILYASHNKHCGRRFLYKDNQSLVLFAASADEMEAWKASLLRVGVFPSNKGQEDDAEQSEEVRQLAMCQDGTLRNMIVCCVARLLNVSVRERSIAAVRTQRHASCRTSTWPVWTQFWNGRSKTSAALSIPTRASSVCLSFLSTAGFRVHCISQISIPSISLTTRTSCRDDGARPGSQDHHVLPRQHRQGVPQDGPDWQACAPAMAISCSFILRFCRKDG
jgi:hypothetical protein